MFRTNTWYLVESSNRVEAFKIFFEEHLNYDNQLDERFLYFIDWNKMLKSYIELSSLKVKKLKNKDMYYFMIED